MTSTFTEETHRFALLAARTGLESELAQNYADDPISVLCAFGMSASESAYAEPGMTDPVALLAEFGLSASEPVYLDAPVVIEDLGSSGPEAMVLSCWPRECWADAPRAL
ncbi:hypothetical protein AMK26_33280 [Streptomyces sp. CB03234]|uniref:hypothetical protein n=1 Tax=Streptomyces sp. (strain CB03234) TaxID=1703937 RepID=UPI000939CAAE|nr:hypothetical protein [Streptomyces sp. CB03234]OKJ94666.1 hypothetical protein AMK26_33280 [Streptomyces sp. CB03234]